MAKLGSSVVYGILNATSRLKEAGQKLANKYAGKLSLSGTTLALRNQEDSADLDTQDLSGAVDSHLSGGTGINYSSGTISIDSTVATEGDLYTDSDVDAHLSGGVGITYSSGTVSMIRWRQWFNL